MTASANIYFVPRDIFDKALSRFEQKWPHKITCPFPAYLNSSIQNPYRLTISPFYEVNEEAYEKIKLLNSPHWEAILKMHSIQYREKLNEKWFKKRKALLAKNKAG